MTSNPIVRKLTFTGSTEIGKKLMAQCAGTVKKVSLELGGNAPFIVFDDADLDAAVQGAIASKYRNTGQTCVCANRLLVQEGVYDAFVAKLVEAVRKLRVGDGLKGATEQGPLIDDKAVAKVEEHIADALAKGGKVALGGKRHALGGTFFEPTIITDVTPNDDGRARGDLRPGRAAVPLQGREAGDPHGERHRVRPRLVLLHARPRARAGASPRRSSTASSASTPGIISTEVAPFGGVKESGIGREGSKYGILDYTELKYFCIGGIEG